MLFQNGDEKVCQFFRTFHPQVFLVVPFGLFYIETGAGTDNAVQRENRNQFLNGVELPFPAGIPPQESQQVYEGLREVTVFAVAAGDFPGFGVLPAQREHREAQAVSVAFGELALSVRLQQQRQVCKARHGVGPSKRLIQKVMQWQRRQPFLSADDLGDFHQVVVHYVGEVVGGELIGPLPEHFVVQGVGVHFHVAANEVVHFYHAVYGHFEADGPVGGAIKEPLDFLFRQRKGIAQTAAGGGVVHEGFLAGFGLLAPGIQLFGRVKGIVCPAALYQLLCILPINGATLALPIRRMGMSFTRLLHHFPVLVHAFVRNNTAPRKCLNDILFRSRHKAMGVRVLDTDDEVSTFLLGIEVVVQGRTHAAHMERAGGRRSKSYAGSSFHVLFD